MNEREESVVGPMPVSPNLTQNPSIPTSTSVRGNRAKRETGERENRGRLPRKGAPDGRQWCRWSAAEPRLLVLLLWVDGEVLMAKASGRPGVSEQWRGSSWVGPSDLGESGSLVKGMVVGLEGAR